MAQLMLVNPRKRTRRKAVKKRAGNRMTVRRKKPALRRRRNPIAVKKGLMATHITPSFVAATGALGLDVALGYMPIPDTLKTGPFRYLLKGAGAIGIGMLASNLIGKKTGAQMATGALTVVMHDAMREAVANAAPGLQLGFYNAGYNAGVGEYLSGTAGMGAYVADSDQSPYLADSSLAKPFAGKSTAREVEERMMRECQAAR